MINFRLKMYILTILIILFVCIDTEYTYTHTYFSKIKLGFALQYGNKGPITAR